ncbi:CGNR zinc finger domain-containing protein [Nocardioides sp. NPDC051685]|uniref:CGNR zinc finger domain-containing protein n=1 Tax=Nocardioides sp. NPDC051685 TaxID=3364334 RepID=UPI0037A82546
MDLEVPVLYPTQPKAVRLMNTVWADRTSVHDSLETLAHLQLWAVRAGIGDGQVDESDLDVARELRDALRRLAADATHDDRRGAVSADIDPQAALAVTNRFLADCTPVLRHEAGQGYSRVWRSGDASSFRQELAVLALEGADLLTGQGLRACGGPGCVLYFARSHSRREWCSAECGNRARVARHYQRKRDGDLQLEKGTP